MMDQEHPAELLVKMHRSLLGYRAAYDASVRRLPNITVTGQVTRVGARAWGSRERRLVALPIADNASRWDSRRAIEKAAYLSG